MLKHFFVKFIPKLYSHWEAAWLGTVSLLVAFILWATGAKELTWGGFAVVAFVCFLIASFQTWSKQEKQIEDLDKKFKAVPRIKLARDGVQVKGKEFDVERGTEKLKLPASCLSIYFENDPIDPSPTAVVDDIIAYIDFYNSDSQLQHLFQVAARWADSDIPTGRAKTASVVDLNCAKFTIGQKRELDIAFKFYEDGFCYAVSNESWRTGFQGQGLTGAELVAKIRLRGSHTDKTWTVRFKHRGREYPIEVLECV
jgi:hypothetical protein